MKRIVPASSLFAAQRAAGGSPPAPVAPANTALPVVSGTARVGSVLTATTGAWAGTSPITYAYQWQRGTSPISGATNATYTVVSGDLSNTLRVVVTATNVAGSASANSANTAVVVNPPASPVNTVAPVASGTAAEGFTLTVSNGTWTGDTPITFTYQWIRGASNIVGATGSSYTLVSADVGQQIRCQVTATNAVGNASANSNTVGPIAAAAVTIATPSSPQPTGAPVVANGSYVGNMTTAATLQWLDGGTPIGSPVTISTASGGTWSGTITAPASAGTYTLRITHNLGPTQTSGTVTVEAAGAATTIATVTFDGSGDGADTVAIFGHSFPQGALDPADAVVLRRADTNATLRTQMEPVATWPDGSVRTAKFAAELPTLANAVTLACHVRKGEAHASPGANLTWSGALSGRSIAIKTWAPGNNTTPLWTYDVAAALTSSSDNWMSGPLALNRRVKTAVPTSAVLTTANAANVRNGVYLLADVTATKDGMILVDAAFCNDYVNVANTGTARFGWTIEIDGTIVYDQRPGSANYDTDLARYSRWVRRRAKKGATVYNFYDVFRPLFRPDYEVLVQSGATLPLDRATQPTPSTSVATVYAGGAGRLATWLEPWGIGPEPEAAGGRNEIGWLSNDIAVWTFWPERARVAELVCHYAAEYYLTGRCLHYDHALDRPCLPDEYVQFATHPFRFVSGPAATPAELAGPITPEARVFEPAGALNMDQEHRGPLYAIPALLSGRRMLYDALAIRATEATVDGRYTGWKDTQTVNQCRFGITPGCSQWEEDGAATVPSWETGSQWVGAIWAPSTRAAGWGFRDVAYADYLLPDSYPRRDFYTKNVAAWINACHHHRNNIETLLFPGVGLPFAHASEAKHVTWMYHFFGFGLAFCLRAGIGGANAAAVTENYLRFRSLGLENDNYARSILSGRDMNLGTGGAWPLASSKAALLALPDTVPTDWSGPNGEGDWQMNGQSVLAALASRDVPSTLRAKAWARDLLVRVRSERRNPSGHPFTREADFAGTVFVQTNLLSGTGWTWKLDAAPVIVAGQTITAATNAAAGAILGCVEWTGSIPRCSAANNATDDAFEITSQPAGNPFTISKGGVIRRSATGTFDLGSTVIQVRARTYNDANTLLQGSAVNVTIVGVVALEAPVNTAIPTISGTTTEGQTLTATTGTWTGNPTPTYAYQWQRGTTNIAGATSATYTLQAADAGNTVRVIVTATNSEGSASATSANTATISGAPAAPVNTALPTVSGTAQEGQTLTGINGTFTGFPTPSIARNWQRGTADIAGATGSTYVAQAADVGSTLRLRVTATNSEGSATAYSANTATVIAAAGGTIWTAPDATWDGTWSINRRLWTTYTGNLIRAIRMSDSDEANFGQISSALDLAAFNAWRGASEIRLLRVYEQSGTNGDLIAPSVALAPILVPAGGSPYTMPGGTKLAARGTASGGQVLRAALPSIAAARAKLVIGSVFTRLAGDDSIEMFSVREISGLADRLWFQVIGTGPQYAMERETTSVFAPNATSSGTVANNSRVAGILSRDSSGALLYRLRWNNNAGITSDFDIGQPLPGARNTPPNLQYEARFQQGNATAGQSEWVMFGGDTSAATLGIIAGEQFTYYGT